MMTNEHLNDLFHAILERHKGILFTVANTYCKNQSDRQDLLQEMMLQIWKSLHNYDQQYKMTTWLYRIALNVAISFFRKNASREQINIPLPDEYLLIRDETASAKQEQLQQLEQFISGLNEIDKAIIILYLEDRSHAEIAEITGLTVTNVGTKIGRIKEKLKQHFLSIKTKEYARP
jgi:RNA polymerase sigma-70 factor (ECF subfamily)